MRHINSLPIDVIRKVSLLLSAMILTFASAAGCARQPAGNEGTSTEIVAPYNSASLPAETNQPIIIESMDHDERYKAHVAYSFIETENMYAGIWYQDSIIRYYDKVSCNSGTLCGRPECTHTGTDCNACVFNQSKGLSYYNGKLYWMGFESDPKNGRVSFSIMRMNMDGTGRESVHSDAIRKLLVGKGFDNIFFHRGSVYFVITEDKVVDGSPSVLNSVFRINLDDPNDNAYVISYSSPRPVEVWSFFSGDKLISLFRETVSSEIDQRFDLLAWQTDLNTLEKQLLLEERHTDHFVYDAQYYDDKLYLSGWKCNTENTETEPFVCLAENGKIKKLFDFRDNDHHYDAGIVGRGFAFSSYDNERREPNIWLIDLSGTTLYRGKLDLAGLEETEGFKMSSFVLVGGDAEAFVLLVMYRLNGEYHASFIRYSMEGGELDGEILFTGNKTLGL